MTYTLSLYDIHLNMVSVLSYLKSVFTQTAHLNQNLGYRKLQESSLLLNILQNIKTS